MGNTLDDRRNAGPGLVMVGGLAISVDVIQNGPPAEVTIAWIHGLGSSGHGAFGEVVRHPALAGTTSILIDLPGHGTSGRPDAWSYSVEDYATIVNETLAALGARNVLLAGHSMGGAVAVVGAAHASGRVERLILVEPSLHPGSGPLSAHIAAQTEARFVGQGFAALVRATERAAVAGDAGARAFLPSLRLSSPVALHRSATSLTRVRSPSLPDQALASHVPKALIVGARSLPFEPGWLDADVKGYVVHEAGHAVMADNPNGFARAVAEALTIR